ncbi:MAG: dUTP diphosphatase, partial [Prevotella sp.]|nr:dUTP diphosphatase [Prevotella sp.]
MIEIKVINKGHHPLPQYATEQSAGMDLRANIDEQIVIQPMQRLLIGTG